jgi:glycosyltransferase involved in cell wall biosynthesis
MPKLFFSFVVPAHNEGSCIASTLQRLKQLDYPADKFEVIVVENGSSDNTFELARAFEGPNLRVLQSGKGVSRAKNAGIDRLSPRSDWVVFLDADTELKPEFLNELASFLQRRKDYAVGTVSLRPLPDTAYARAWFFVHNIGHMLTKTSYSIKIVKRTVFPANRFDEDLVTGEDVDMIRKAEKYGKFFFMWTKNVSTSTRRFEKLGWWYVLFYWSFVAILPVHWQKHFGYEAVR